MNYLVRRRREANVVMVCVLITALVGAAVLGLLGYRALRRYTAARNVEDVMQQVPKTPVGLLVTLNDAGALGGLFAVVGKPGVTGGHIVSIPVFAGERDETSRRPFATVLAADGIAGLQDAVETATQVSFDTVEVVNTRQAVALMTPFAPLQVTLRAPVLAENGTALLPAGAQQLDAEGVVQVLNNPAAGTEASRSPSVAVVLAALAKRIGTGIGAADATTPVTSFGQLWQRVVAGPVSVRTLGLQTTGHGAETYNTVDASSSVLVFATIAPSNVSAPGSGLNFRIEAPPGSEAHVRDAIDIITFFGGNVVQIDMNAASPEAATIVQFYDDRDRDRFQTDNAVLGTLRFAEPTRRIEGVNAVMVLGAEFLAKAAFTRTVIKEPPDPLPTTPPTAVPATDDSGNPVGGTDLPGSGVTTVGSAP